MAILLTGPIRLPFRGEQARGVSQLASRSRATSDTSRMWSAMAREASCGFCWRTASAIRRWPSRRPAAGPPGTAIQCGFPLSSPRLMHEFGKQ